MSAPTANVVLDDTDRKILAGLASGLTNRQVASRVGLAPGTVANRIVYALRRTGAKTRIHLVVMFVEGDI